MKGSIVKTALIGGLIVFLWTMVSWMVLPFHKMTLHSFKNETEVTDVIKRNTPETGMYTLPGFACESDAACAAAHAKMKQGPFVYASVRLEGKDPTSPMPYILEFVFNVIVAFVLVWLLSHTKGLSYMKQVVFFTLTGTISGALVYLQGWNWWGTACGYTFVGIFDLAVSWFLAGLAMAKLMKK